MVKVRVKRRVRIRRKRFVGFYNYTVILTFLGMIAAVLGMAVSIEGYSALAILCLMIAGLCDAFDGRVARRRTKSTEDERSFGIQLDSLCDMVCYGALPVVICYNMGMKGPLALIIMSFFVLAALTRLAYFNVLEINRQRDGGTGATKAYHGLPVTAIAFILPVVYLVYVLLAPGAYCVLPLYLCLAIVGFLFIFDFKVRKPGLREICFIVVIMLALLAVGLLALGPQMWATGVAATPAA